MPRFPEHFGARRVCGFVTHFPAIRAVTASDANLSRMDAFYGFVGPLLGLGTEPKDLTFLQISLRGIIVFLATLAMIRVGHKRSLARKTAFDGAHCHPRVGPVARH